MNSKSAKYACLVVVMLACALIVPAIAQTPTPNSSTEITLSVDADTLTIYLLGEGLVSLEGLGFAYKVDDGWETIYLEVFFDEIEITSVATPACFRLQGPGGPRPLPTYCQTIDLALQDISPDEVFWYDYNTGSYRKFYVVQDLLRRSQWCPDSGTTCSFEYPFQPTPEPTNATPIPTPGIILTEPSPPSGYTIYDNFDGLGTLGWRVTNDSPQCSRTLVAGGLWTECFGSENEDVSFTLLPADRDSRVVNGVAMAFYTLPVQANSSQWGKYQLQIRFGPDCDPPDRGYNISIRPNELSFVEYPGDFSEPLNSPVPTMPIAPFAPQVIRIEYQNGLVDYYLNDEVIFTATPRSGTSWVCWMFQSDDNNRLTPDGYRGMVVQWVAIK